MKVRIIIHYTAVYQLYIIIQMNINATSHFQAKNISGTNLKATFVSDVKYVNLEK